VDQWLKIIFSDECSVERGAGKNFKTGRFNDRTWLEELQSQIRTGYIILLWQNLGSAPHIALDRVTLAATALTCRQAP
jgi:hypothetical protein